MDTKLTKNGYLRVDLGEKAYLIFDGSDNPSRWVMTAAKVEKKSGSEWIKPLVPVAFNLKSMKRDFVNVVGKENVKKIKSVISKHLKKGVLPKENMNDLKKDFDRMEL